MERYQLLQHLCQFGIALFTILAALSTYGAFYYGEKKDDAKNESKNQSATNKVEDTSRVSKTTYNINGDLVQGDKVSHTKNEEINAPEALIVTKDQSGGVNTVNVYQNEYKPIDGSVKNSISEKLNALHVKYPKAPVATIEVETGNTQRHKIALDLETLLQKSQLGEYPKGNTFMGRFPDNPISVFINPSNRTYVTELIKSLGEFISEGFVIVEQNSFPSNFIRIYINGQPLFDTNGKVKVQ